MTVKLAGKPAGQESESESQSAIGLINEVLRAWHDLFGSFGNRAFEEPGGHQALKID
jgi:hypothetical protein